MSADAMGWTFRHSPFVGATLLVHLSIADSVNDQNGNELWMSATNLARKARVSRRTAGISLATLTEAGFLTLLAEAKAKPTHYRFEFPDGAQVMFETRRRTNPQPAQSVRTTTNPQPAQPTTRAEPSTCAASNPQPAQPVRTNPREPKEGQEQPNNETPSRSERTPEERFERFWLRYPKRHGKREGKADALRVWMRMIDAERKDAWDAAKHYAAACDADLTRAMDAHRWLTRRRWVDWAIPATARAVAGASAPGPMDFFAAAAAAREAEAR